MVTARVALSWRMEHENFTFLLDFLEQQTASFGDGGRANFDLLFDVVAHLNFFSERYHVAREEVAFGYLRQKDPTSIRTIDRLSLEHRVLFLKGKQVYDLLGEMSGMASSEAMAQLAKYVRYFRHHIAVEEGRALPRVEAILTESEWEAVQNAAPPAAEPFREFSPHRYAPNFGDEAEEQYHHLRTRIVHLLERPPRGILERRRPPTPKMASASSARTDSSAAKVAPSKPDAQASRAGPGKVLAKGLAYLRPYRQVVLLLALVLSYLQYNFLDVQLQIMQIPEIVFYFFNWGPVPTPS